VGEHPLAGSAESAVPIEPQHSAAMIAIARTKNFMPSPFAKIAPARF